MTNERANKRIETSPVFLKHLQTVPSEVRIAFRDAYELFLENPNHPSLRNHALTGTYQEFRSIDITGDWRVHYREEPERFLFVNIGTHEMLYGKE